MKELFGDDSTSTVTTVIVRDSPPPHGGSLIKRLKNNKTPWPDQKHRGVLKLLVPEQIKLLTKRSNTKGLVTIDFIPIPKKINTTE